LLAASYMEAGYEFTWRTVEIKRTVPSRLCEIAAHHPDLTFCTFIKGTHREAITFSQLLSRSIAYANQYQRRGLKPGDLVIIVLQHTPHLFYSYLGAILVGAVPSFMPFPSPKQRRSLYWADHDALFARITPQLLVTYEENFAEAKQALPRVEIDTLIAREDIFPEQGAVALNDFLGFAAEPDDVACLQHSSGTTSLKKGVMLTHRAILDEVEAYASALDFGPDDSIASWLPLYHDMGFVACFMGSLLQGTHLVALDPFEWVMRPSILLDAIQEYRCTFCWLPNFAFSHIAGNARKDAHWNLSSIRAFVNCSEPCKAKTFERFAARFAGGGIGPEQLQVCYAMAENVFAVTQTPLGSAVRSVLANAVEFSRGVAVDAAPGAAAISVLSCGPPVEGVRLRICDPQGTELPDGRIGEIHITGPFLFSGYYKLPEKTREKLRDGWYRSGDMGFMRDGELYVTGRADDMIIVNGQNFYAHEIEAIANGVTAIVPGRAVAIAVEETISDSTAVALLAECVPGADAEQTGKDVRREILEQLGLAIHAFVPVAKGELVKTTSGKISRSKNKEIYARGGFSNRA
jgi:fatty-acyl-CoA synthase